jgi:drug/metabolite transporter (DMT)-like permease
MKLEAHSSAWLRDKDSLRPASVFHALLTDNRNTVASSLTRIFEKTSVTNRATLALALASVAWGLWWLPLHWLADRGLSGYWQGVVLYGSGALILALPLWPRRQKVDFANALLWVISLFTGVALAMYNAALLTDEVVRVTLLFYLSPIWSTLLAFIVLKEPIRLIRIASVAVGLLGAAVVLGGDGGIPMPHSLGEWMGFFSGVGTAIGSTYVRKAELTEGTVSPGGLEQTCTTFLVASAVGILFALTLPSTSLSAFPSSNIFWSTLPWAVGITMGWLLPQTWFYFWSAKHLDPGRVSLLMLLEVPVAAISAALVLHTPLGWHEVIGCALVILAGSAESLSQGPAHLSPLSSKD